MEVFVLVVKKIKNVRQEFIIYNIPCLDLCGNETTINCFIEYVKSLGIEVRTTINKSKKSKILYTVTFRAKDLVINTLEILYKEANVYLERKYQKYLEVIEKYKKPTND